MTLPLAAAAGGSPSIATPTVADGTVANVLGSRQKLGWWFIQNPKTGTTVASWTNDPTQPFILHALGLRAPGQAKTYIGSTQRGGFTGALYEALAQLGLSIDAIPNQYSGGRNNLMVIQQGQGLAGSFSVGPGGAIVRALNKPGKVVQGAANFGSGVLGQAGPGGGTVGGDTGSALSAIFNQAVTDAKYGALLLVAIVAGAYLVTHALTGQANPRNQGATIIELGKRVAK